MNLTFKSIKHRLIFWFLIIALVPLMVSSVVIYIQRAGFIRQEAVEKLTAIRDLKANQIIRWIEEKKKNVHVFSQAHRLRSLELSGQSNGAGQIDPATIQAARDILNIYQTNYRDFGELFFIEPASGRILVSTNRAYEGHDKSDDPYFTVPMNTRAVCIKDIYYSHTTSKPSMAISLPVYSLSDKNRVIGILVGRIDLKNSLDTLMLDRTGMGETGETLIANKESMALSELRHHANAPLNLRIREIPAVLAAKGETGAGETEDYRGAKVLAAYTHIPATQWGFVAKQDLSEVYAPINELLLNILIIVVLSTIAVIGIAIMISKRISDPIRQMVSSAEMIAQGNPAVRIEIDRSDEIGQLSRATNIMAETIASQLFVQQGASDAVQSMVGATSVDTFNKAVLQKLMELTGTPMGVFYARKAESTVFYPMESVGANSELLQSFNADTFEGEFGVALAERKISRIRNLPEDTVFQFKTFTGNIVPKEIITIPIISNGKASAVICLASLQGCPQGVIKLLDLIRPSLNSAYANFLAAETTQILSDELSGKNQELEAQTEELTSLTEELRVQSEELRQQYHELDAQKQQVESANRLKSQFLANMSHELRTPLNAVLALSRVLILQTREMLSEEQWGYLEIIERNGRNLLDLINDILDLAKIESGRVDISPSALSIGSIVETITESLEPLAAQKGLKLTAEIPDDLPKLYSDEARVYQILQNLVANALKFTEQGGVAISVRCDGQTAEIQVKDTGIGIAEADLASIFDEFRQVDGSSSRRYEGTGLGLTIATKAAAMLGGNLSVQSTPGSGSVFSLTLPVKWPGLDTAPTEPKNKQFSPRTLPLRPSDAGRQEPRKVLIVEDNEAAIIQIKTAMATDDFHVVVARDGRKAMALISAESPDAIVLDLMVPELDGFEILKKLQENPETARIPVLIMTARDLSIGEKKLLQFPNVAFLFKKGDVDFIELGKKIRQMTGQDKPCEPEKPPVRIEAPDKTRPLTRVSREKPTVLVIEDNADNRATVRAILKDSHTVIEAIDGEEGLKVVLTGQPDIVLLDVHLPGMDGISVVKKIKGDPRTGKIPVLAVSASAMTGDREAMLAAGCDDFIAKPIDPEALEAKIAHWLKLD